VPATLPSSRARESADLEQPLRVFFALWPDAATRDAIAALARDVVKRAGGRAPRPENAHLTLAFVGDVAATRVSILQEIGAAAARDAAPFTLALDRIGGFRAAGIAWVGAATTPPVLVELAGRTNQALAAAGFRVERRPFHPHVTLARRCERPPSAAAIALVAWRVEGMTLTESRLRHEGSCYRELAAWPFAAMQ
jgi:2'-5' RNA ligase